MSLVGSPTLLRKQQSLWAASVISKPNWTAKKGSDCGQTDATTTLCFDASHFCQRQQKRRQRQPRPLPLPSAMLRAECVWTHLIEGQNTLHLLQVLLSDPQGVLLREAAVTGEASTEQQLGTFFYLKEENASN